jgi:hypothetical protein
MMIFLDRRAERPRRPREATTVWSNEMDATGWIAEARAAL